MEAKKRRIKKITVESVPKWAGGIAGYRLLSALSPWRPALFAGRWICVPARRRWSCQQLH